MCISVLLNVLQDGPLRPAAAVTVHELSNRFFNPDVVLHEYRFVFETSYRDTKWMYHLSAFSNLKLD